LIECSIFQTLFSVAHWSKKYLQNNIWNEKEDILDKILYKNKSSYKFLNTTNLHHELVQNEIFQNTQNFMYSSKLSTSFLA